MSYQIDAPSQRRKERLNSLVTYLYATKLYGHIEAISFPHILFTTRAVQILRPLFTD